MIFSAREDSIRSSDGNYNEFLPKVQVNVKLHTKD